jgi:hypothetical protein
MLDFNHVLATPGLDAQYFQGPGWTTGSAITVTSLAPLGILNVTAGTWQVGQAIRITGTFSSGSITGYTPGAYYYIITVTSTTQITISASSNGVAVTSTASTGAPGATFTLMTPQWQTWRKPRGIKWVYMLGVGGGGSGGTGINTAVTGGGPSGGGSGSQTVAMVPAMFVPDVLYIAAGNGGVSQTTSGVPGLPGLPTYVAIEADTGMDFNKNLLWANPGNVTSATVATPTTGGQPGTAASPALIGYMPLAGRGFYNQISGQASTSGSLGTGGALTLPTTGLICTAGTAGGGTNTGGVSGAGGDISLPTGVLGSDFFTTLSGGSQAVTSTPAKNGSNFIARNFIMNYGGTGGGGATTTAGGSSGAGGDGAPGCGGGGSGSGTSTNTTLKSGAGGPGFVFILSW